MVITRETAKMLLLRTYVEFYAKIREFNGIARDNGIYEAREIRRIYDEFNVIYGLTDQDYGETIQRKIKESFNEDLTKADNEELKEILLECVTLARLYDLTMKRILTSDIEIIERLNNEESDKLIEVKRLLADDVEIGEKVLADVRNGTLKLKVFDYAYYITEAGVKKDSIDGFYDEGVIFFKKRSSGEAIATTIVHEYIHYTQEGSRMTRKDRERYAYLAEVYFCSRMGIYHPAIRNGVIDTASINLVFESQHYSQEEGGSGGEGHSIKLGVNLFPINPKDFNLFEGS